MILNLLGDFMNLISIHFLLDFDFTFFSILIKKAVISCSNRLSRSRIRHN